MMGTSQTAFIAAFAAGTVSSLSPCLLPLVPGYLSYIASESVTAPEPRQTTLRVQVIALSVLSCKQDDAFACNNRMRGKRHDAKLHQYDACDELDHGRDLAARPAYSRSWRCGTAEISLRLQMTTTIETA